MKLFKIKTCVICGCYLNNTAYTSRLGLCCSEACQRQANKN